MMNDVVTLADETNLTTLEEVSAREVEMPSPEIESVPPFPHPLHHPFKACGWLIRTAFGIASLMLLLAFIAAVPILNILVLGYLLNVMGKMARTGQFRTAFPLLNLSPRLGSIALGMWICVFPLRLLANAAADAHLVDPGSPSDVMLHRLVNGGIVLMIIHICLALARGGSLSCFFRPIRNARWLWTNWQTHEYLPRAAEHVKTFIAGLQLKYHFLLGVRGLAGAFVWLVIPTAIFASADRPKGGDLAASLIGGFGLVLVIAWLPFLTARYAAENRFSAMFELRAVRKLYARAPIWGASVVLLTCILSLPMYLFKVALPPQDAMWLETLVFLITVWPVKVFTGWVYHRATLQEQPRGFLIRWLAKLVTIPLVALYVFVLFFTQFIGEHGKGVLFEHHAFLLPIPF